jgi:hypothetical protein
LIPNPIRGVLSSMQAHRVCALLLGGQACGFYGAAEFSRDTDLAVVADPPNLGRLRRALKDLEAEVIAVPPFELKYLRHGHAVHFRCRHPEAFRMRVDIMSKMRGVDAFSKIWARRTTLELPDGTRCGLLSLPDLVQAKKTQRDKDWPMIRRLVEAHYFQNRVEQSTPQVIFWLRQLRTAQLLAEVARQYPAICSRLIAARGLLASAATGNMKKLERALALEESAEREADRRYWSPLKAELERLRHPSR